MSTNAPTFFLSAAEASGDHHAAGLIHALRRRIPDARFIGVAGPQMAAAGCEVVVDLAAQATMTTGPFTRIGYYIRTVRRLKKLIAQLKPDVFIPVDSPALNWHLSAAAKAAGSPVVHYVCPQVWAWARWRIKKLRRLTDHVACLLPFEARYMQHRGVPATFVGHPLFDDLPPRPDPLPDLIAAWADESWRVAMLPGSRMGEIRMHMPALLATADLIRQRHPNAQCRFLAVDEKAAKAIALVGEKKGRQLDIVVGRTSETLGESHFAVAVSGTVTLEVAYYGVPMVIFYHVPKVDWELVGRWIVHMPHLSLVNILSPNGRPVVPELMPWHGNIARVQDMVVEILEDLGSMVEARGRLLQTVEPLLPHNGQTAADNAADLVLRVLNNRS
ncbi:MAG: lipid-A-disaccharide synthase [Planctomycetaceae bacterium]|nr:lipid-A-disaccharide synthase [Planctomycetaceae bacterium]